MVVNGLVLPPMVILVVGGILNLIIIGAESLLKAEDQAILLCTTWSYVKSNFPMPE